MSLRVLMISVGVALVPLLASASDSGYEKALAKGLSAIEQNDYAAAAAEFGTALGERPDDLEATLYLGIARSRANSIEAEATLKKALSREPTSPRANLELGILYLNRGMGGEAGDYFENTVTIAPDSPEAANAREHLRLLKTISGGKNWGASFQAGLQYDNNVPLIADGSTLPAGVKRAGDWRGIFSAGLNYSPVRSGNFELDASYSLYQSLHFRLGEFDVNRNRVELSGKYAFNDKLALKSGYVFEYQFLGGDGYAENNIGNVSFIVSAPAGITTSLDYRYRDTGYRSSPMFPFNKERSGGNHQVGFTSKMALGDGALFRIGYYYDRENARREYWDYGGNKGQVGITAPLPFSLVMEGAGEAYFREYDAPYPAAGLRKETTWTASLLLSRFFGDFFTLTAGIHYNRNDSNIPFFDYDRTITSLLAQVRF